MNPTIKADRRPKIGSKKSVLEWRSAKTIRKAPDKIGNVNKSIPPVIKRVKSLIFLDPTPVLLLFVEFLKGLLEDRKWR